MPKVICNFTTWKQRDWCVPEMLSHFQKQTAKPDMVICWLSHDEYNGKAPQSILSCVEKGWITDVRFVDGNTFGHKRYEVFKKFDDAINILMDDDIYYPTDYVEKMIEYSNLYPECAICYYTRQETYIDGKRIVNPYSYAPSHTNRLMSGLSCFPPHTFPMPSFDMSFFRDKYCKKCDDSWVYAWLIKCGTKIAGIHDWGKTSPLKTIKDSQECGIWATHNSVSTGTVITACQNLSNAIKIAGIDSTAKELWPRFDFDQYTTVPRKIKYTPSVSTYPDGVSVCISAYNADKYIEEAINSVANQTYFKCNSNYEIIIGIDGCEKTLSKVNAISGKYRNIRVYMMDRNCGTYITSNTIISKARYSHVIRFDSDDVMEPNMVETLMNNRNDNDIVRYRLRNFGKNSCITISWGSIMVKHSFLDAIGGYRPWICSGDAEMIERVKKFAKIKQMPVVLFRRRVHDESLTQSKETSNRAGSRGTIRMYYYKFINSHTYATLADAAIPFIITSCREVIPSLGQCSIQKETTKTVPEPAKKVEVADTEKLIVTMTTWYRRIENIPMVLDSILSQTKKPDKIVINLSEEEFSTNPIPMGVKEYIKNNSNKIEVQWIKGPNTKQWKKILPTMLRYQNDAIVCIDDDATYPSDMLQVLWDAHRNNPGHPISGFNTNAFSMGVPHCGTCNLDKLEYYGDIFECLTDDVMTMYSSDIFFTLMALRSGHKHVWCGRNFITERKTFNEVGSLGREKGAGAIGLNKMYRYLTSKYGRPDRKMVTDNRSFGHMYAH